MVERDVQGFDCVHVFFGCVLDAAEDEDAVPVERAGGVVVAGRAQGR